MVLKTGIPAVLMIVLTAVGLWAQEPLRPGEMRLPLKDYLSLVETVERLEKERARKNAQQEKPLAEVVSQRLRIVLGEGETAAVTAELEVLVQGQPKGPVTLPVACVPQEVEVKGPAGADSPASAAGAVTAGARGGEMNLVVPTPGRYTVRISGPLSVGGGVARFNLPPAAAPVAVTEIVLPADRDFMAPGAVVVEDREAGGLRTIQLTTRRGEAQSVEVRRKVENGETEKLLAQSVVLTLLQLLPDGPRRHDVVLYEVSRGGLGALTVDLPAGLVVEQAGTDEGDVIPVVESRRLTIHRRNQLRTTGYLVLTSVPVPGAEMRLEPVTPAVEARARYLALASAVAADVRPLPEAGWSRVDLDDLPPSLREAFSSVDLAAAWRLTGPPAEARVAVSLLPPASSLPLLVKRRDTTSLLTVDGTLLHRDRLTLRPPGGVGAALDILLPSGAKLWSAQVDGLPVRPLERGSGTISVPLGFEMGKEPVLEIVSVLEKAIPPGRSELALGLPQVSAPVEQHRWRLLLPDGPRYRYRSGELRPAGVAAARSAAPGVATDRINVGGNESGDQAIWSVDSVVITDTAALGSSPGYYDFDSFEEMQSLKKGLVGGIKPLPITIPEAGKLLLMTGVLPPAQVGVELEVKAKR